MAAFPVTANGKIDRAALLAGRAGTERTDGAAPAGPRPCDDAEMERRIAAIWGAVLARPGIGRDGLLARASLIRTPGGGALVVVVHHIVSDGWSMRIVLSELAALYAAFAAGRAPSLPEQAARDAAYWRETLANAPAETTLPFDRPRGTRQSFRGDMIPFAIPPAVSERLRALARAGAAPRCSWLSPRVSRR